ncbi:MAG: hypothetical protein AB8I69_23475 [Anaerolineae bacterium]
MAEVEVDETVSELAVKQLSEEIAKLEVELEGARLRGKGLLLVGIICLVIGLLFILSDQLMVAICFWTAGVVAIVASRSIASANKRKHGYLSVRIEDKRSELMRHLGVICQSQTTVHPSCFSDE